MNSWTQVRLEDVADVKLSNVDKKSKINQRTIKLCNYTDVYKQAFINSDKSKDFMVSTCSELEYEKFKLKKDQVAITKDSEKRDDIGISTYISESFEDVVLGYHLSLITPHNEILSGKFLNYFFNSKQAKQYFENNAGGSGQRCTLPIDIIKSIPIRIPSFKKQEEIAAILFALDEKIELNNKINIELEQMAKTLYDYWFVQFDFPNEEGKTYKSSGGEMVYNEVLKREIPKGWEVKKLTEIAQTGSGGTPKSTTKEYYENGNIPWINSGELNSPFIISTKNFITEVALKNSSAKYFPANTILMAMYGATAGKTSIISFEATTNQAICAVMPKEKEFFHYTKFVLDDMYQYLINLSTGSARDNLSQDKIKNLDVIIPDSETLKKYSKQVATSFEKIKNNLQQNQELASLRDWLLPMLMNGQVKVGENEAAGQLEDFGMVAEAKKPYQKGEKKTRA